MNPTGKIFSRADLTRIAELCQEFNVMALCDEVYEHLVFAGAEHIPLASLPGMRDLAVRVGSAGKSFSLTGWKIGYLGGSAAVIEQIARAHQFLTFTIAPHLQHAVAWGLQQSPEWFAAMAENLAAKRARFVGDSWIGELRCCPSRAVISQPLTCCNLVYPSPTKISFTA